MSDPLGQPPGNSIGLPGEHDPVYQIWVMLLNGYGYNWYRIDNQLRADDLLIRSRASEHLAAAAARLRDIEAHYRRKYLPPPTREHPYPDPDHLAAARHIRAISERILELDTRVRGAAVPPDDKIWIRYRDEVDTLWRLSQCDVVLVGAAKDLSGIAAELPLDGAVDAAAEERIDRQLGYLRAALAQRGDLLA
jgi:hypothetical protein